MKKKKLENIKLPAPRPIIELHESVPIHCRVLIVCEGKKTEPNYFQSFHMMQHGGIVFEIETEGKGENTKQVVQKAINLRDYAESIDKPFDSVWAVFDRDSFSDEKFNTAIQMAEQRGINTAWSNEAFELWYVLHFQYRNTPMSRNDYAQEITFRVNEAGYPKRAYKYKKNAIDSQRVMSQYGSDTDAIRNAERLHLSYTDNRHAQHNPCTTVYQLVRLLRGEDNEFNHKIIMNI